MDPRLKSYLAVLRANPTYVATFSQVADSLEKLFASQEAPRVVGFTQEQIALITNIAIGVGSAVETRVDVKLSEVKAELAPHLAQ